MAAVGNASRTCPGWCAIHDPDGDVCLGDVVTVKDDAEQRAPYKAHALSVSLAQSAEDGLTVGLSIDYIGPNEVTLAAAKAFAEAILEQCRQAEAALIPGPRVASDVDPVSGRDYAEEAWQRAEAEREGLAELAAEQAEGAAELLARREAGAR